MPNGETVCCNGNIPPAAIESLESEIAGLVHGTATLTIHIKDGNLIRYVTSRERSFVPGKPTTGSVLTSSAGSASQKRGE
jgi:hypothetical protein